MYISGKNGDVESTEKQPVKNPCAVAVGYQNFQDTSDCGRDFRGIKYLVFSGRAS